MSLQRPTPGVVIVCDYFPPAARAGGPTRTLLSITQAEQYLAGLSVVTRDRDLGGTMRYGGDDLRRVDRLLPGVQIRRLARHRELRTLARLLRRELAEADMLYLNSLLSPVYSIYPLTLMRLGVVPRRPVLLAPRGELAPGALAIKSAKKRMALPVLHRMLAGMDVTWHASSDREASDIRSFLGRTPHDVIIRTNPAPAPDAEVSHPANDRLTIMFVGRMVPIKNFLLLARAAAILPIPARIVVAGSLEDREYWGVCRDALDGLPHHIEVEVRGHIDDHVVADLLRGADVMVLPTRGENFGRAIAEALAVGCPVMIPDTTMWTSTVRQGAGWLTDPDDPEALSERLTELARTPAPQRLELRDRVHRVYSRWWADTQAHDRSLFQTVFDRRPTRIA